MFKYGNDFFFGNSFIEKIILDHPAMWCPWDPDLVQIFDIFFPLSSISLFFVVFSFLVLSHKGEVVEAVAIVSPLVVASEWLKCKINFGRVATRPVIGCSLRDKGKIPEGVVKMDQSESCGGDRQSHFYNRNIDNHQKMPRGDLTHKSIRSQTERTNANRTSILLQFMIKLWQKIVTNLPLTKKVRPFRPRIVNVRTIVHLFVIRLPEIEKSYRF